jgi:small subunit ribosomal protein S8
MNYTDPVADMLARINNAHLALFSEVKIPASKLKVAMADILKSEGFVTDYKVEDDTIVITLKYAQGKAVISGLKRVSRPGRRVYVGAEEIPRVLNGLGICIVSTSRGIFSGETARAEHVGGELMCEIW